MEKVILEFDPNIIEKQITSTLQEMGTVFNEPSKIKTLKISDSPGFSDGQNEQGLINTAEALECFFIPYFGVSGIREKFWNGDLISLNSITTALFYLIQGYEENPDNDGIYRLSGTPYINFKLKRKTTASSGIKRNLDFLDTASFILPALMDAKAIEYDRQIMITKKELPASTPALIPEDLAGKIDKRIYECALLIKECDLGGGKGWCYTNDELETDKQDFLYFSWTAIEALDTLYNYAKNAPFLIPDKVNELWGAKDLVSDLDNKYLEKRSYLSSKYLSPDNENLYICNTIVSFGQEDSNLYYNLFAIIGLLITGCEDSKKIKEAVKFLVKKLNDSATLRRVKSEDYGKFQLIGALIDSHEKEWSERAFLPLFVKALCLFREKYPTDFDIMVEELNKEFGNDPKFKSVTNLLGHYLTVIDQQKYTSQDNTVTNVWDNISGTYSIYYTERVIESLNKLYTTSFKQRVPSFELQQKEMKQTQPSLSEKQVAPTIKIEISPDLIKNEIINSAKEAAQKAVSELLKPETLRPYLEKELSSLIDFPTIEEGIQRFFNFLLTNINNPEPEKRYQNFAALFATLVQKIVGQNMGEAFFEVLKAADPGNKLKDIDKPDFAARFRSGMQYLVKMETEDVDKVIDFVKTFQCLEEKELLQTSKQLTTPKKKR